MATQGWFNHYDDPDDDYWEQSPEGQSSGGTFKRSPPPSSVSSGQAKESTYVSPPSLPVGNSHPIPTRKSSLITIEIGEDRLPIRATLNSNWTNQFEQWQYSTAILDAYHHALHERMVEDKKAKVFAHSKLPSVYDMAPALLQTRSTEEYREVLRKMIGTTPRIARGPAVTQFGTPALQICADQHRITSIELDPEWARSAGAAVVGMDIVFCSAQLRRATPTYYRDRYLDQESEGEIHKRLAEHLRRISED
ncbi:hypothetical protein ACFWU5_28300 [Nocardia sp. NPDC058640]|uniref:hypothetical protein n=1 Tax=Nocardia sp. NPDC058640 TaxID=3346571 RepID=UPI00364FB817